MRITITEAEIKTAITDYIAGQGFNLSGKTVEIDLKATRGDAGYTADIDIETARDESKAPVTAPSRPVPADAPKTQQKVSVEEKPAAEAPDEDKTETADEDEAPTEKPKSLFGGMKKPVNSKPETEAA